MKGAHCWAAAAIASTGYPRTWGAERERSASTHATRVQNGRLCILLVAPSSGYGGEAAAWAAAVLPP
eukprot:6199681-Pleurochrysis_carterae.AAC.3